MAFAIYKPGQGKICRLLSAAGAGAIIVATAVWLWWELSVIQGDHRMWVQAGVAAGTIVLLGGLVYRLLNKPRIVDFMIATEAEMRKVNWPTRREIIGSTWIVICGTLLMALLLWIVDLIFAAIFMAIGILEGESPILALILWIFGVGDPPT